MIGIQEYRFHALCLEIKALGAVVKRMRGSMFKFEALEMKSKFGQQPRV